MDLPPHPIPDSYWVDPGRVFGGPLPTHADRAVLRQRVGLLLELGVRTVVDLRTPAEPPSIRALLDKLSVGGLDPVWFGAPILNGGAASVAQMQAVLDLIDGSLARERGVYVHCQGGLGRTGSVVACWWIRHGRHDPESALAELMRCRLGQPHGERPSPETPPQYRLVRSWAQGM
jgi:hypothetical protein